MILSKNTFQIYAVTNVIHDYHGKLLSMSLWVVLCEEHFCYQLPDSCINQHLCMSVGLCWCACVCLCVSVCHACSTKCLTDMFVYRPGRLLCVQVRALRPRGGGPALLDQEGCWEQGHTEGGQGKEDDGDRVVETTEDIRLVLPAPVKSECSPLSGWRGRSSYAVEPQRSLPSNGKQLRI